MVNITIYEKREMTETQSSRVEIELRYDIVIIMKRDCRRLNLLKNELPSILVYGREEYITHFQLMKVKNS